MEHGEWRIPADAAKPERKSRRPFPTTVLGEMETCPAKNVRHEMAKLLDWWKGADVVNATATVAIRCDH